MKSVVEIETPKVHWSTVLLVLYEDDAGDGLTVEEICEDEAWLLNPRDAGLLEAVADALRLWLIEERRGRFRLTDIGLLAAKFLAEGGESENVHA